jgi:pyridoxal phosphate enzyme (YggS family)
MTNSLHALRLEAVRDRLALACERASRPIDSVALLAVTKTRPDTDLQALYDLGLRAMGENRIAEAVGKQSRLPRDIEWHMIGHLQSNKAKDCLGFGWLHSLDRFETAQALEKVFAKANQQLNVLLEANTGGEAAKDGVSDLDGLRRLAEGLSGLPHLRVRGLMTMAPFTTDESVVRPCFVRLRGWRDALALEFPGHQWDTLSMGMTNDFGWAVEEGSTLVRIGTALFEGFR